MNLATVRGIYTAIGKDKFNSLAVSDKNKPHKRMGERSISEEALSKITDVIKKYTKATRSAVIKESNLSSSAVDNGVKTLSGRGEVDKDIIYIAGIRTAIYTMTKAA